jgi:hypothetical protein
MGLRVDVSMEAAGPRGVHEILGRAPETDEEMVIVRIDNRAAAREVRENRDGPLLDPELPGLCIVTGRSQGRLAHKIPKSGRFAWLTDRDRLHHCCHRILV